MKLLASQMRSNLGRDLMVQEVILNDCKKHGITVLTADGQILTDENEDDPTRILIRQVLGSVSQFEKSCIVQKLRAARNRIRKEKGKCEVRDDDGYTPLLLAIGEGRIDVVRKLIELCG